MEKTINITLQIKVQCFKQGLTQGIDTKFVEKLEVIDKTGQVNIVEQEVIDYEVQE